MSESIEAQQSDVLVSMNVQQLARIALVGALVGIATWGIGLLLDHYVLKGIICQGTSSMQCTVSFQYASISASILAGGLGLFGLARMQIFRSFLVVAAATLSLWELASLLQTWQWQIALPISLLLFAVSYSLFAWLARIRSFIMALIVVIIVVAAARLALNL